MAMGILHQPLCCRSLRTRLPIMDPIVQASRRYQVEQADSRIRHCRYHFGRSSSHDAYHGYQLWRRIIHMEQWSNHRSLRRFGSSLHCVCRSAEPRTIHQSLEPYLPCSLYAQLERSALVYMRRSGKHGRFRSDLLHSPLLPVHSGRHSYRGCSPSTAVDIRP